MRYFIIQSDKDVEKVIDFLIKNIGLPSIHQRMNIYPANNQNNDSQIQILDNQVYFQESKRSKFINIKNKNLKSFFRYIARNDEYFFINDICLLQFSNCNILFDTYHGNIISTEDEKLIESIKQNFNFLFYENISEHKPISQLKKEKIFDSLENLNSKIKEYAIKTGLDIRSASPSMRIRLSNLSNNYSHIEKYYRLVMKDDLLSLESKENCNTNFKNMSIIIPIYNQDVTYTLLSIQGQNLSKEDKLKIQVILIDDGSQQNNIEQILKLKDTYDFKINIISFPENQGLSNARNVGFALAKYDIILFMDSDIVLSKNYLRDINTRLQIIPNGLFVAMRKNIESDSSILNKQSLINGVEKCNDFDDSRIITNRKDYHIGWDIAYNDDKIMILDDSNYFKQLGFGAKIGIYDLPAVVAGHNMAISRQLIKKFPIFSNQFEGWGMEDTYFASLVISNGCFVIPLLSSCVYHINHPPRSGNLEQKIKEARKNYELYNKLLDEKWEE